jgi:sulfonate transport system permease protein
MRRVLARRFLPWLMPVLILVLWQITTEAGVISSRILPPPSRVIETCIRLLASGVLEQNIMISFGRAIAGFAIGGGIGFLLGFLNGCSSVCAQLLDSTMQMIRNIPHLALIPLIILWFGIGEEAKIVLVAIGSFFPVYVNTYYGIRSVDPELQEMGRVYGLSRMALFWEIILPGALPSILVGVRYGLGLMWITLIVAETIATDSGIGFMTMNAREFLQTDVIVLGILIYAALGKLADETVKLLEIWLLAWNPAFRKQ